MPVGNPSENRHHRPNFNKISPDNPESLDCRDFAKQNLPKDRHCFHSHPNGKNLLLTGILAYAAAAFRKTLQRTACPPSTSRSKSPSRLSASDTTMLERNRLQPPRPSAPSQTAGGFDGPTAGCGGLFASAEDYDCTGILAGVDLCESRYWWMPELYSSPAAFPTAAGESALSAVATAPARETADASIGSQRSGLLGRLMRAGQAARRTPSRSTAAA
jgi:hypothetical protein